MWHDIIISYFCSLTVEEHLWFYGRLKGMDDAGIKQEMQSMIIDVGLPHKSKALCKTLSGNYILVHSLLDSIEF